MKKVECNESLNKNQICVISFARYSAKTLCMETPSDAILVSLWGARIWPPETNRNICLWVFLQMRETITWGPYKDKRRLGKREKELFRQLGELYGSLRGNSSEVQFHDEEADTRISLCSACVQEWQCDALCYTDTETDTVVFVLLLAHAWQKLNFEKVLHEKGKSRERSMQLDPGNVNHCFMMGPYRCKLDHRPW